VSKARLVYQTRSARKQQGFFILKVFVGQKLSNDAQGYISAMKKFSVWSYCS